MKVMFICTGNICRSAMAHWLLESEKKNNNIEVYSCGIYAEDGDKPTYNAIEAMKEYDVDLGKHSATNIRNSKIKDMDLILCMTTSHKRDVLYMYPELKDKVFTLKEYTNYKQEEKSLDIRDPWGYDLETYRFCAAEIYNCIEILLKKIKENKK